jgi:PEP-CTERM motif
MGIPGTVTGEVIGLQNNVYSTPQSIIITSDPDGIATPFTFYTLSPGTFFVNNGIVTYGEVGAVSGNYFLTLDNLSNYLGNYNYTNYTQNSEFFAGVTYTLQTPEPSTWTLLLSSLGLLAFCQFRSQRV